jgi:RNA polymerase sigma-70 factor (ECF subfamily)
MTAEERAALEQSLRAAWAAGDIERATTLAIGGYGPEIFGLIVALHSNLDEANDVFAQFCEDTWRGLPGFAGRASFRTWAYTLARHASHRARRRARRPALPLSQASLASRLAADVRTATLPLLRTEGRDRFRELRESLPVEDQTLLILRVDKELGWNELAQVFSDGDLDDDARKREAARLRKRFQLIKEKLRALASQAGLVPGVE